jgi:FAD/FMN-containing dehydrogenase
MRKHGLTVDNLLASEVVTAEGSVIRASADDLLDARRVGRIPPPLVSRRAAQVELRERCRRAADGPPHRPKTTQTPETSRVEER